MNKINGKITNITGCISTNRLTIDIETSDEISLTELIGKDVEVSIKEKEESSTEQKIKESLEKKGCEKYIKKEDRICGDKFGYREGEVRDYVKNKTYFDIWLCEKCASKEAKKK